MQELYIKICKILLKDDKQYLNTWRDITIFIDWKAQYCKSVKSPLIGLLIQCCKNSVS